MKNAKLWIFVFTLAVWVKGYAGGHIELSGYPTKNLEYKFEIYTGAIDRWDSVAQEAPPLSPGKAIHIAKKFVRMVPLEESMEKWDLHTVTLVRMASSPEEWIYKIRFDGSPKGVWNGPVPWIEVPVRFDGTIPKPTIKGKAKG